MANPIALIAAAAAAMLLLRGRGDEPSVAGSEPEPEPAPDDEGQTRSADDGKVPVTKSVRATLAIAQVQPQPSADVPNTAYCADVANWPNDLRQLEVEILAAINALRQSGANCNPGGSQPPAPPLTMNKKLRCAARKHSKDMAQNGFFGHQNPQGQSSFDRIAAAGYNFQNASENLTAGPTTVQGAIQEWLTSTQGHCAAMFHPGVTELGVGVYKGGQYGYYWTTNFGKPA
jgi:uncharacterized protein YkwD